MFSSLRYNFLLFVGLLGLAFTGTAQDCGTVATFGQIQYMDATRPLRARNYLNSSSRTPDMIPIQFHVVRRSNGTGGISRALLNQELAALNTYYINSNLQFFLCDSINYIDDDNYYSFDTNDENTLISAYNRADVINVYFFGSIPGLCGYTYFPAASNNKDLIMMANGCANGSTLVHEVGHFFSLYHTHGKTNTGTTDELVTRAIPGRNCTNHGDDLCDTEADPNLSGRVNGSCLYTGSSTDANGDAFIPDPTNIMSYSRKACRTFLSPGQYNRVASSYALDRSYLGCNPVSIPFNCSNSISTLPYVEDFESFTLCSTNSGSNCSLGGGWTNASGDDLDWITHNAGTPSSNTGPAEDYNTAVGKTQYLYVETSSSGVGYPTKTAVATMPCFDLSGYSSARLFFAYHMLGGDMGRLEIKANDGSGWVKVAGFYGENSGNWDTVSVDLSSFAGGNLQIAFEAVSGRNFESDIAIDNVELSGTAIAGVLNLSADQVSGPAGSILDVPVRVRGFSDVVSLSASFNIQDTSVATLVNLADFGLPGLGFPNFTLTNFNRDITLNYNSGSPVTVPDDSAIFKIRMLLNGNAGDTMPVSIVGMPIAISVTFNDGSGPVSGTVNTRDGRIEILPALSIGGTLRNEAGQPLNAAQVELSGAMTANQTTGTNGQYLFSSLLGGQPYQVTPGKTSGPVNGVNTLDIVFTRLHILGTTALSSPYRIIGADTDGSQAINGLDIVRTRQLILGQIANFPNSVPSWRFVPTGYAFANPATPFSATFPENLGYAPLNSSQAGQDFVAIKVGDVDGSASTARKASAGELGLRWEAEKIAADNSYRLVLRTAQASDLLALQFGLDFDGRQIEVVEMETGELPGQNLSQLLLNQDREGGHIRFSWDEPKAKQHWVPAQSALLSLKVKARGEELNDIPSLFQLAKTGIASEAYPSLEAWKSLRLLPTDAAASTQQPELFQNHPNPFSASTRIRYRLHQDEAAELVVLDLQGREIGRRKLADQAGLHSYRLDMTDFASGIYFAFIQSRERSVPIRLVKM
jgi:hypothetical protein